MHTNCSMHIEIKIPVHPAVPKFLAYSYNTTPFLVCTGLTNRISPFGLILYNSLVRVDSETKKAHVDYNPAYTVMLTLKISEKTYQHKGWHIMPKKVDEFNRLVMYFIYQDFCQFIDIH
ncbi:MAG: hypothetical protein EOP42_31530, partial [Sphingobacteriaceae bacterium]